MQGFCGSTGIARYNSDKQIPEAVLLDFEGNVAALKIENVVGEYRNRLLFLLMFLLFSFFMVLVFFDYGNFCFFIVDCDFLLFYYNINIFILFELF